MKKIMTATLLGGAIIGSLFGAASANAESAGQRNAVRSAESYVDMTGFSRSGLIEQLEYEDFSAGDATYAADHVGADWNAEAVESAQSYLDMTSFSKSGLIEQLEYEGFTPAQAAYGANVAYGS